MNLTGTRRASPSSTADRRPLRQLAEACRDLDDPVVMAKASDDPQDTREGARRSPARLITQRFPIEDTVEAFRVAQNGSKGVFHVVVEP
jgi:hypothetical protein